MLAIVKQCSQNGCEPHHITAQGIPRDGLVEFVMGQPAVDDYLAKLRDPALCPEPFQFTRWHPSIDGWSLYPKHSHTNWLIPGERVLYHELAVSEMVRLHDWKAYVIASIPRLSMASSAPSVTSDHSVPPAQLTATVDTTRGLKRQRTLDELQPKCKRAVVNAAATTTTATLPSNSTKGKERCYIDLTQVDDD